MEFDDHALGVGRIVTNLQSLEFYLRMFFCAANGEQPRLPAPGDVDVEMTTLTNFASLTWLVDQYNQQLSEREQEYKVDRDVVSLRDTLAHGRLLGMRPEFPMTIYKFGRDAEGRVPVELCVEVSEEWLTQKMQLVHDQVFKIAACAAGRHYENVPQPT